MKRSAKQKLIDNVVLVGYFAATPACFYFISFQIWGPHFSPVADFRHFLLLAGIPGPLLGQTSKTGHQFI